MTSSYGSAYYAAPKKRPPVFLIALGLLLAAGVVAIVYTETSTVEAESPAELAEPQGAAQTADLAPVAHPVDDRQQLLEENARLRDEVERLEGLLASAEVDAAQLADLNQEVLQLRAELERYRAGLKNAVGELNAQRQGPQAAPAPPPAASRRSDPPAEDLGRWVFPRDPYAIMNPTTAEVSGSVHNANDEPVSGYVVLQVQTRGASGLETLAEERVHLRIPAKTVKDYSKQIRGIFPQGAAYEVTALWKMDE